MQKKRLMFAYHDFIKAGKFKAAWLVLNLLKEKSISIGLDDASYELEKLAQKLRLRMSYGRSGYSARIFCD